MPNVVAPTLIKIKGKLAFVPQRTQLTTVSAHNCLPASACRTHRCEPSSAGGCLLLSVLTTVCQRAPAEHTAANQAGSLHTKEKHHRGGCALSARMGYVSFWSCSQMCRGVSPPHNHLRSSGRHCKANEADKSNSHPVVLIGAHRILITFQGYHYKLNALDATNLAEMH